MNIKEVSGNYTQKYDLEIKTEQLKDILYNRPDSLTYNTYLNDMKVIKVDNNIVILSNTRVPETSLNRFKNDQININIIDDAIRQVFSKEYFWKFVNYDLNTLKKEQKENTITPKVIKETIKTQIQSNMVRANWNFDNYIESKFNEESISVFKEIIQGDDSISIVFLSGKSGYGKTHLLHATINELTKKNKSAIYIDPYQFTSYISPILKDNDQVKISKISKYYANIDVLVFDDFQIFGDGDKKATKNFLFKVIDSRMMNDKLTIFASEYELKDLNVYFDERLLSRLRSGFQTKIQKPDKKDLEIVFEQLIKRETEINYDKFTPDSVDFVVSHCSSSIRDLIGAVKRLKYHKKEISNSAYVYNVVRNIFADFVNQTEKITPEIIIENVSKYYKISQDKILGKSRNKDIVIARHMAINLIKVLLDLPSTQIGKIFKRDHSTILSAIEKFTRNINEEKNDRLKWAFDALKRNIGFN